MIQIWTADEEAERLGERFRALKENTGMGQAKFARQYDVPGGASIVNQHIKGHRPISQKAAIAYANGFGCPLAEISPRIALEIESAANVKAGSSPELEQPTALAVITPMTLRHTLERLAYFIGEAPPQVREVIGPMLAHLALNPHNQGLIDMLTPWFNVEPD